MATGTDGVQNGDESDVDCGGTTTGAPKCAVGKTCNVHADCQSDGCAYDNKCAVGRSCTQQLGGDTCGPGDIGNPDAAHESCCERRSISGSTVQIDKYLVTAGRMRAFIERLNGDVVSYVSGLAAANWNQSWNTLVPASIDDANMMLGPYWNGTKRSCGVGQFNGHTYYTTPTPDDPGPFTQADLDPKTLNCVGWHIATAFCQWDGGRLPSAAEIKNIYTNNGVDSWPWGNQPTYSTTKADDRVSHRYNYGYPGDTPPLNAKGDVLDSSWYVPPPGRFPLGNNKNDVADAAGDMLVWVKDSTYNFVWTMSWDDHDATTLGARSWSGMFSGQPNGYFAIGFRCAHD
ncbi:MAG: hypothetical protein FWD69_02980 [Polyangiaceae bacterium]|nr:hypothetical protein [Polyangiaceae bacterium]